MAEHGEWTRKGASLSDVTAIDEYGVSQDFILRGIRAGTLEYREGSIWGNPYLKILRSQLEQYITVELGSEFLACSKAKYELRSVKTEIGSLRKRLKVLENRKSQIEEALIIKQ